MDRTQLNAVLAELKRLADALERRAPAPAQIADLTSADAFVWHASRHPAASGMLEPVAQVNRLPLSLLKGIDRVRDILLENTRRFALGFPANNALLWGARGMGKSALIKAVHGAVAAEVWGALAIVEIYREDIESLPELMRILKASTRRAVVFCDDLSFDGNEASYKSLKAVLEGGLEGRPSNVVFYATSNRRHLMPREMMENERSTAINPSEAVEEKVSLSDRFGLWLGFHNCSQDDYLAMVEGYVVHFGLKSDPMETRAAALEWAATRGARSGRVARQFIQDLAGRLGAAIAL